MVANIYQADAFIVLANKTYKISLDTFEFLIMLI